MGNVERLTNGTTGGPVWVYVQDGKILRIDPDGSGRDGCSVLGYRGPRPDLQAASPNDPRPARPGSEVSRLLTKAHPEAAQEGRFRPQRLVDGLDARAEYSVAVETPGYTARVTTVLLEKSLNLGTITLEREGGRGLTQGGL